MRVLVIGGNGMLGRDVVAAFRHGHNVLWADRACGDLTIDITDRHATTAALRQTTPELVINCAAFTDVDRAEREPDEAYRINAWGTWNLASACELHALPLMHVSTDFVFDGEKGAPYMEFDRPHPINEYGSSKLAGEHALQWSMRRFWLVRTQWLFGAGGKCFPGTMLKLAARQDTIDVIDDQFGSPAYSVDVAAFMKTIVEECPFGVYHVNNSGECSWHDFARAIVERGGYDADMIRPISAERFDSPTKRPRRSTLRRLSLEMQGKDNARSWQDALADYFASL
ncbi:MAG TPA: dTDP-4-dehydrorhamnose reductase [Armatimonadota bacterium]